MTEIQASGSSFVVTLPRKILITGHTGFKGTWMTLILEKLGVEVIGFSLEPQETSLYCRLNRNRKITESYEDICNLSAFNDFVSSHRPDAIIHMAAQPLVIDSYENPYTTFNTNVMGTVNVMECASKNDFVKAVLVVTTDKVYENNGDIKFFEEKDSLKGSDPYSCSKVATEAVVRAWQSLAKVSLVPYCATARAGNVIGGGDYSENRIIPDLIKSIEGKKDLQIRNLDATRPWQHVIEPLFAYLLVLGKLLDGVKLESINIGPDGQSLSVGDVIQGANRVFPSHDFGLKETSNLNSNSYEEALSLQLNSENIKNICGWLPIWTQSRAIELTFEWWRKVLDNNISPLNACQNDIQLYLDQIAERFEFKKLGE